MNKLGYLGPEGSYSYIAAKLYDDSSQLVAKSDFYDVFDGVENGELNCAIVPIENSTEGAVTLVMDALLKTKRSSIVGEITITVKHLLLGVGERIEDIRYILSHSQALQQCRQFLKDNYPHIQLINCNSSSEACFIAKEKGKEYGAIANRQAGELSKLNVILSDLQDNEFNQTRFIVIGNEKAKPTGNDKTSIAFSLRDDSPGSLFKVLEIFANNQINLTRIESRPAKAEIGKYVFYIDLIGHVMEPKVSEVLGMIEKYISYLKVFGSYAIGEMK